MNIDNLENYNKSTDKDLRICTAYKIDDLKKILSKYTNSKIEEISFDENNCVICPDYKPNRIKIKKMIKRKSFFGFVAIHNNNE